MKQKIVDLSKAILIHFKNEFESEKEITIFLCGGIGKEESALRYSIGRQLSKIISKYTYSVYYPEDMFTELISATKATNLLSLENILGDSVHCVVILLNSPGTFAELGAFSNHEKLCNKLIIIVDNQYQGSRGFITLGPLRYLKHNTSSKVLYSDLKPENSTILSKQLAEAAREIPKHPITASLLSNPISAIRYYLALIYVFDPLPKSFLREIIKGISTENLQLTNTVADTIINYLNNRQEITIDSGELSITDKGKQKLLNYYITRKKLEEMTSYFSNLRLEALNLLLRR